jgi:outer membrane protein insertion porin family
MQTCSATAWNQPRVGNSDVDVATRAFQQVSCSKRLSSFDETARGVSVTAAGGGPATVDYSLVFREIAVGRCRLNPVDP